MSTPEPGVNQTENQNKKDLQGFLVTYGRMTGVAAALAMSMVFAFGAWFALKGAVANKPINTRIHLIKADPGPLKVKPKDPGGLKIPNQDKLVFERITPEIRTTREERLAPEPEEPIATSDVATKKALPKISDRLSIPEPNKKANREPTTKKGIARSNPKAEMGYRIQLAAFRKEDQAKASWIKLQKLHTEILKTLIPLTIRIDLGKKGVYFRVQAGYFTTVKAAQNTCKKLQAKGQGCIIKRPK